MAAHPKFLERPAGHMRYAVVIIGPRTGCRIVVALTDNLSDASVIMERHRLGLAEAARLGLAKAAVIVIDTLHVEPTDDVSASSELDDIYTP